MSKLVRIHPLDSRHTTEVYLLHGSGYSEFRVGTGWQTVSDSVAATLAQARRNDDDPESPLVFEVCTKEEAEALEQVAEKAVAKASEPRPIPTAARLAERVTAAKKAKEDALAAIDAAQAELDEAEALGDLDREDSSLSTRDLEAGTAPRLSTAGSASTAPRAEAPAAPEPAPKGAATATAVAPPRKAKPGKPQRSLE